MKELEKHYEDLIIKYDKKVMKLEYIIHKAIEYIKENKEHRFAMNYEYGLNEENINELLKILGDKDV